MVLAELVSLFALCCYQCAGSVIVNVCSFRSSIVTWLDTTSRLSRGMTSHRTVTICTWLRGLGILRATLAAVLHGNDVDRVVKKNTILLSLFGAETYQHICNLATIWLFTILVYGEMGGFRGTCQWAWPYLQEALELCLWTSLKVCRRAACSAEEQPENDWLKCHGLAFQFLWQETCALCSRL